MFVFNILMLLGFICSSVKATLPEVIRLKSDNGNYLARCRGCITGSTEVDQATVHISDGNAGPYVYWQVEYVSSSQIRLKSDTGNYLSRCNSCVPGAIYRDIATIHISDPNSPHVIWTVEEVSTSVIRLKSDNGKYLSRCNSCFPNGQAVADTATIHISDPNSPFVKWTVEGEQMINCYRTDGGFAGRTATFDTTANKDSICNSQFQYCGSLGCKASWNCDVTQRQDGCSFDWTDPITVAYKEIFREACNRHDLCYSGPWTAIGGDGFSACNNNFFNDMYDACSNMGTLFLGCLIVRGVWSDEMHPNHIGYPYFQASWSNDQQWVQNSCSQ